MSGRLTTNLHVDEEKFSSIFFSLPHSWIIFSIFAFFFVISLRLTESRCTAGLKLWVTHSRCKYTLHLLLLRTPSSWLSHQSSGA